MINIYNGTEPYIFISYSHKNKEAVFKAIEYLSASGFRVWYDNGIAPASEWPEYIAEKMISSHTVMAFISKEALESHNCRREINFAIELKKELLVVYLEDIPLSPGMRMQLCTLQAVFRSRYESDEHFHEYLSTAAILAPCLEPVQNTAENCNIDSQPLPHVTNEPEPDINADNLSALKYAVEEFNDHMKKGNHSYEFKLPEKYTKRRISNAISSYANNIAPEEIVYFMDDTFMGNGKSGYILTGDTLYSGGIFLSKFQIPLNKIAAVKNDEEVNHLIITFTDGTQKKYFFNIYYKSFNAFFSTYLRQKNQK